MLDVPLRLMRMLTIISLVYERDKCAILGASYPALLGMS